MKGLIFIELLQFAEPEISPEAAGLVSGDRYEAAANYDHRELLALATRLADAAGVAPDDLIRRFGTHLFHRFARLFPAFLVGADSTVEFLASIGTRIHSELTHFYPDAEFPSIACERASNGNLRLTYHSERCLADLAEGLIRGCAEHFGETIDLRREELSAVSGQAVRFSIAPRTQTGNRGVA